MGKGKGIIIGLAGLAIGGGIVGGVSYYLNNKKPVDNPNGGNSQVDIDEDYSMYELPAELKHLSFEVSRVSEDYDVFSSSAGRVTYVLDKKVGKFKFLAGQYFDDVYGVGSGKALAISEGGIKTIDFVSMKVESVDVGIKFSTLTIKETSMGFIAEGRSNDGTGCKLLKFDKGLKVEYMISMSEKLYGINNVDVMEVECGYLYYTWNAQEYNKTLVLVDKEQWTTTEFSTCFKDKNSFVNKGNKVYFGTDGYEFKCIDVNEKTETAISDVGFDYQTALADEVGHVLVGLTSAYTNNVLYCVNVETNEVKTFEGFTIEKVADLTLYAKNESQPEGGYKVSLYDFDVETQEMSKVYSFTNSHYDPLQVNTQTIEGRSFMSCSSNSDYTGNVKNIEVTVKETGEIEFKPLEFSSRLCQDGDGGHLTKIADGKYLIVASDSLCYFDLDTGKGQTLRGGHNVKEFSLNEAGVLTYEMSNGLIYTFNTSTGENAQVGVKA